MTTQTADGKIETVGVMVNMPVALKEQIEAKAKENGKSVSAFLREMSANDVGYTGPLGSARGRKVYASEEERQAVIKARAESKRNLVKELMQKYEDQIKQATAEAEAAARAQFQSSDNGTENEEISEERPRTQPPAAYDAR